MKKILRLLLFLLPVYLQAQEKNPDMETDRPDQTETASVVPLHSLQIETGFVTENDDRGILKRKYLIYNTTLLRYGLFTPLELRLGLNYEGSRTEYPGGLSEQIRGLSPFYTGFKVKLREEQKWLPSIAFIGALNFPFTAGEVYRLKSTGVDLKFTFSHVLSEYFSLGYNLGTEWDGDSTIPHYSYTLTLAVNLSEKLGAYVESFGDIHPSDPDEHLADGGFTYLLLPNLQLDFSAGIGLRNAIQNYISLGLSYRFPK